MKKTNHIRQPLVGLTLALAGACAIAAEMTPDSSGPSLTQSLVGGKPMISLRYRFELYEIENLPNTSKASTLRAALGYETAPYHGLSLAAQFESVNAFGD